jgi:glucosamine-phosphate N-acetyltransferase
MEINTLVKTDFENYLDLMRQFRPIDTDITYDTFCQIYDKIFTNSEIYVARLDGKIIGSITVIYEQKFINNLAMYAHIEDVVVDTNYRKHKIGSSLLDYVKYQAIRFQCYKCTLSCSRELSGFYQYNDFEEKGIHMTYLIDE